MNRTLVLTSVLAAASLGSAHAASLAEQLPAGALFTIETKQAQGLVGRVAGLLGATLKQSGAAGADKSLASFQEVFKGSVSQEAVLGVFAVKGPSGSPLPQVLGVTRVDNFSRDFFAKGMAKPTARVGAFTFGRQGAQYSGMSGGLMYFSTNKDLLMAYLGRLSGKAAPLLLNSAAYSVPKRALGQHEVSLYANFSGLAKVLRGQLQTIGMPRLFSPFVDAVDTMGQYVAGANSTAAGLDSASVHAANPQGQDKTLYQLLTHTTNFEVQSVVPASAESVAAHACHPETGAYWGRWLTRIDLFDASGALSDSQLATHLAHSGTYLGDECAQVSLAGGVKAGLNEQEPLDSLNYSVAYQRVRDMAAAKAEVPQYVESVNKAIASAATALGNGVLAANTHLKTANESKTKQPSLKELTELAKQLKSVRMVYGFRGDYLVTAYSDQALQAALNESAPTLAQLPAFQAAQLPTSGAGWSFVPKFPTLSGKEVMGSLNSTAEAQLPAPVGDAMASLLNRFNGASTQSSVQGNLIVSKTKVAYRW